MLIGTFVAVLTSWRNQHTQRVLRQMTQTFHQQVAFFKMLVSFCLVLRVPEAVFLLLALVLLTAWLSHPLIASLQSPVAKARRAGGKENPLRRRVDSRQTLVHLASCQNHRPHVPSLVLRCPRSVRLRLAQLVVDHITLLVFVLNSACCVDKLDIVQQCSNKAKTTVFSPGKRSFGTYALGFVVFDAPVLWCNCRRNRTRTRR